MSYFLPLGSKCSRNRPDISCFVSGALSSPPCDNNTVRGPDRSICCPDFEPARGSRAWHGGQRSSLPFITDETVSGGWSSSLWACGPLLRTLGLDEGDPRIRGSPGVPRILQVQASGSGEAGQLVSSQWAARLPNREKGGGAERAGPAPSQTHSALGGWQGVWGTPLSQGH